MNRDRIEGGNAGYITVAIFGLVSCSFGLGLWLATPAAMPYPKCKETRSRDLQIDKRPSQLSSRPRDVAGMPAFIESLTTNPEPCHGEDNEKRDLAAQEAAALWVFWAAIIAGVQLLFSGAGLWAVVKTIRQGRDALRSGMESARESRRSADAAHDANRPWLELELGPNGPFLFDSSGARFTVDVIVHNRGASPATNVLVITQLVPSPIKYGDSGAAVRAVREIISNIRVHDRSIGRIVFPNSPMVGRHSATAEASDVEAAERADPNSVTYELGVGVRYRFGERTGETVYSYNIVNLLTDKLALQRGKSFGPDNIRFDDRFSGYAL